MLTLPWFPMEEIKKALKFIHSNKLLCIFRVIRSFKGHMLPNFMVNIDSKNENHRKFILRR